MSNLDDGELGCRLWTQNHVEFVSAAEREVRAPAEAGALAVLTRDQILHSGQLVPQSFLRAITFTDY